MLPATNPAPAGVPAITRARARIIWWVLALALVGALAAAVVAARLVPAAPRNRELASVLLLVAGVTVTVELAMAYLLPARMRRNPSKGAPAGSLAATQTIVASALAIGSALLSCVFFFVTRAPLFLLLVAPCALVLAHWFPSEARWAALGGGAAQPNRLVRG